MGKNAGPTESLVMDVPLLIVGVAWAWWGGYMEGET